MGLTATEQSILKVVAELKRATVFQISRQAGLSHGYVGYLCSYLVRGGYLESLGRSCFYLAPKGKKMLVSQGYGLELDKELVKELASQVAKEVAKEIKIKGGLAVSSSLEEKKKRVQIKTDYVLPIEDESMGLETNIDRLGAKLEKQESDIDKSVESFKKIQKRRKKQ